MKPIFAIVMVLVAIIAGAGSAFFVVKSSKGIKPAEAAAPAKEVLPTHNIVLDERTVNLADTNATRYVRLTLAVEVSGKGEVEKLVEEKQPQRLLACWSLGGGSYTAG